MIENNSMKHHSLKKEDFYCQLNLKHFTYADYTCTCAKRLCKYFEIKNFGKYCDLYVQSNILLLVDVFKTF